MSTPKYDGGAAYPVPMFTRQADGQPMSAGEFFEGGNGMTLRDYFAGEVVQGMLACPIPQTQWIGEAAYRGVNVVDCVAIKSYEIADAMLAARNK